ncbi:MAG: hypothetical protein H6Q86_2158, partial [candidate division NC10 bacterium]|nr:hypothetical protein [candidate division NC10 bacterium]
WQATETILSHFGPSTPRARSAYRAFVTAGVAQGRRPEFQGGGLRRSVGSWAEVHALRQAGTPTAADARILGGGEFVERLLRDADTNARNTLRIRQPRPPLDALAQRIAQRIALSAGVPVAELRAGRHTRSVSHARRLLCQLAVRRLAYPGATVARFLGVTTSAVNRAAWSALLPELDAFT